MASDHRGRPLHAGKRTNQDTPNAVSEWTADDTGPGYLTNVQRPVITEDVAMERGDAVGGPMRGFVGQSSSGKWLASLNRSNPYNPGGDASLAEVTLHNLHEDMDRPDFHSFRTEKRAKIAVEAMVNRRNEGRDYKTGRGPNFPKGTGRGKPY